MKMLIDEKIQASGLKKTYIADKLSVNRDTLSNWMYGRSIMPLDKAVQLAEILGCEVTDLYEE